MSRRVTLGVSRGWSGGSGVVFFSHAPRAKAKPRNKAMPGKTFSFFMDKCRRRQFQRLKPIMMLLLAPRRKTCPYTNPSCNCTALYCTALLLHGAREAVGVQLLQRVDGDVAALQG